MKSVIPYSSSARRLFSTFVFAPILLSAMLLGSQLQAADRPNVLLICVDDLKPALGCFGDKLAQSPNIDRLAARSVVFERAYCNQAVCSPSRNALLTSLRSQTLGIYDLGTNFRRSRPDAVTLPQYFKQNGYRTEAMGKIFHVGHGNGEDAASWSIPHWRPAATMYALDDSKPEADAVSKAKGKAKKSAADQPRGKAYESADVPDNTYGDGAVAEEAVKRLQAAKKNAAEPFFIAVGFVKPHLPFVAPKKYWDMYDRNAISVAAVQTPPEGAPSYAPQFGGELRNYRDMPKQGLLEIEQQRTLIHGYYAAMSYMDAQVGKVLGELDSLGLRDNTIIVLWGDHGWHLGDHGMWCKHTNYEQAARIPLIVSAPGKKQGTRTTQLAESVDVYPTLCELAGLKAPSGLEGRSFVPTLNDPAAPTKDYILHVYPRSVPGTGPVIGRAIRNDRYRLVEWKKIGAKPETAELELYDYVADPLEKQNLAASQPELAKQLHALIAKLPEALPQISATTEAAPSKGAAKPKQDRDAMFTKRDKDGDGSLTKQEFLAAQPDPDEAPARFLRFDANQDGKLSRDEFVNSGAKK